MKVTLPAAMYYTGVHSQAEYNIALEGGWNFCCHSLPEPGGQVSMKGAMADFSLFLSDGFVLFLWLHVMRFRPDVSVGCGNREEPTVMGRLTTQEGENRTPIEDTAWRGR